MLIGACNLMLCPIPLQAKSIAAMLPFQDPASGRWHQVLRHPPTLAPLLPS